MPSTMTDIYLFCSQWMEHENVKTNSRFILLNFVFRHLFCLLTAARACAGMHGARRNCCRERTLQAIRWTLHSVSWMIIWGTSDQYCAQHAGCVFLVSCSLGTCLTWIDMSNVARRTESSKWSGLRGARVPYGIWKFSGLVCKGVAEGWAW